MNFLLLSLFTVAVLSSCPPGAFYMPEVNKCFLLVQQETDFFAAEQDCRSRSGHLASIHNAFVNSFLSQRAQEANIDDNFFAGANDVNGTWQWTDGSAMNYRNWGLGQPNDNSQCASVDSNGVWDTYLSCLAPRPYFCEVPPTAN